jgi:hypothetical protein
MEEISVEFEAEAESPANMPRAAGFPYDFAVIGPARAMRERNPGRPLLTFP